MHPRTCARGGTVGVGVTSAVGADGAVERVEPDQKRKFFFQSETARWLKEPRDDVPSSPAGAPLRTGSYWRGRRDSPPATAHNPARSLRESDDIGYRRWIRRPRSIRRAEASESSETKGRTPSLKAGSWSNPTRAIYRRAATVRDTVGPVCRPRDRIVIRKRLIRARSAPTGSRARPGRWRAPSLASVLSHLAKARRRHQKPREVVTHERFPKFHRSDTFL